MKELASPANLIRKAELSLMLPGYIKPDFCFDFPRIFQGWFMLAALVLYVMVSMIESYS
jgi:hypothetical protein